MIRMKVGTNNSHLEELQYYLAKMGTQTRVLPYTADAMKHGAERIRDKWRGFAEGGQLDGVKPLKNGSRRYTESIQTNQTGPFEHEIYSDAEIADWIENGTKELDMKTTHPYGPRSRVSKKGVPYLIVPFQWGTEEGTIRSGPRNIVPKDLVSLMLNKKKFKQSKTVVSADKSTHTKPNAAGVEVGRAKYQWGGRLNKDLGDMAGMVRFEQGSATDNPDRRRYGGYFTFRIISAKSPKNSWIKPATPARHVTQALVRDTQEYITKLVELSIAEDLPL